MCCSVSASFLVFSLITLVSMFTLTMLNMIFSIATPKEYESFIMRRSSAYSNANTLSLLDDLKKVNSYDKTSENIRVLKSNYETVLIEMYTEEKIEELNDKVKKHKNVLMAFGITSFSVIGGFIVFFVPIYTTFNCGANCSEECDCNCDCYFCLGVTPIKRIMLFYLVCSPTVLFSIVSFFLTLSKSSTYEDISSMKDIKEYQNRKKKSYSSEYEYDYFGDSVTYNDAQFTVYIIILILLVVYPVVVWLTSSKEEMNPPIVPYKKKVRNKVRNINENTELSVSYNSHPPQPQYHPPPPQPQYRPPPPQPQYRPPPPQPQYRPPPPQPHYHPPPPQPHYHPPPPHHQPHGIGIPIPRLIPPNIVISIH